MLFISNHATPTHAAASGHVAHLTDVNNGPESKFPPKTAPYNTLFWECWQSIYPETPKADQINTQAIWLAGERNYIEGWQTSPVGVPQAADIMLFFAFTVFILCVSFCVCSRLSLQEEWAPSWECSRPGKLCKGLYWTWLTDRWDHSLRGCAGTGNPPGGVCS